MIVGLLACVLVAALFWTRREGFSMQFKANGSIFKSMSGGVADLGRHAFAQADRLKAAAVSMVPFRPHLRRLHRHLFKKNIGVVYD